VVFDILAPLIGKIKQFVNKKLSYRKQIAHSNNNKVSGGGFTGKKAYGRPLVAATGGSIHFSME